MNRQWVLLVALLAGGTGCHGTDKAKGQVRSQVGEDAAVDPDAFANIGMKTLPDNTAAIPVSGVGLVYKLQPGTGSSAQPGGWRTMLENNLKKQGFNNLKELLDDPNRTTSLVLVSALVPPGARKGELIDVQISLPEDSKTTSLKGGALMACELVEFDTTGNLSAQVKQGQPGSGGSLVLGNSWAKAEGPVTAGSYLADPGAAPADPVTRSRTDDRPDADAPTLKAGRIWGGGRVTQPRAYYFLMKPGDQNIRMAATVAERLNATFQGPGSDPTGKVAEAKTRELVLVNVPYGYRNNHLRFLLVARQVPVVPVATDSLYRRKLEDELLDPATALTAAVKLEALGGDSRRVLRLGLESPSPWVRFAAAEALAYLGHTDGANDLAKLAEDHPALRAHCLKALAATDEAAFTDRLVDLMGSPDPALRYGAFLALRLADENSAAVRGQLLPGGVWVHRAAGGSGGLVHLTSDRRSEVVIFGEGVKFRGPFTLPVGADFTASMAVGGDAVRISRIVRVKGEPEVREATCPPDLTAVLATMAKFGGGYGEAVELLKRADGAQVLTAPVAVDAIPRQMTVQQLAGFARADPALIKADVEVARVGTVRPDIESSGVDLPADPTEVKPPEVPPRPGLAREPGRIFGPKHPPEAPVAEPLTPVVATTPAEPVVEPAGAERSRNPGTLFPRK